MGALSMITRHIGARPPRQSPRGDTVVIGVLVAIFLVGGVLVVRYVRQRRTQEHEAFAEPVWEAPPDRAWWIGPEEHPGIATSGGVFISYRRQEAAPYARSIREELSRRLGSERVFMDLDSIEVGVDFAEAIQRAIDACQVLLAVIGPQWATVTDAEGRRRLDDPDDTVRREIEAGLARDIRVIPVLLDGTPMPRHQQLPHSLWPLTRRNALDLSYIRYPDDIRRLLEAVDKILGPG